MNQGRKVTAIEVQKKNTQRVSVFLDGEFAFGIHQDVLLQSGIARGDELSEQKIGEILALEEHKRAKEKALRLLSVRSRSIKEMRDRLRTAKFSADVVDGTIAYLQRLALLDDTSFAQSFARNRTQTRPEGAFLLRQELRHKGLSDHDVEKGIDAAFQEQSERQIAYELAAKKKKTLAYLAEEKAKKRLNDFLLRRGFDWDIVNDIMENWEHI
ncbi:RecX family transcriptional regulator [candidate division KSB1 bacterium]|nr:RecX family transcriptional regulator [candidate division KSB1 bacterium]